jgi:tRNA(fMet)-specific endonuclease VapC
LIDTDILSEFFKGHDRHIVHKVHLQLLQHGSLSISLMSRYEILRGLKAKNATAKLAAFEAWCLLNNVFPLSDEVVLKAADLYANLKRTGQLIGDNDLFIAATALFHGFPLATRNVKHFGRVPGLTIEDWTKP